MKKVLQIWGVDSEIALKMRVLSVAKGVSMGALLTEMVEDRLKKDSIEISGHRKMQVQRLLKNWVSGLR